MEDERLAAIKAEQQAALDKSKSTYDNMLQDNQNLLDQQTQYAEQYEKTQNEALDKQLALYQENINKQKEEAMKNKEVESLKAKNDYVAFSNPYGANAENLATKGQSKSGIAQTVQLGGYNAYQNRLASANKTMQDAITQYDLDMNEAIVNNDVQKAQNALAKLEMMLGYTQSFYDTKNTITQNQMANQQQLDSEYYGRYQDMINQINYEKEMAEKIRQYEQNLAYQKERDKVADEQWQKEYDLSKKTVNYNTRSGDEYYIVDDGNTDYLGNSIDTQNRTDFYADNGYQPAYIGNTRVTRSGLRVNEVFTGASSGLGKQNIWLANGRYYVWVGDSKNKTGKYKDVTSQVTKFADNKKTSAWG